MEQHRNKLKQGSILVAPNDLSIEPKILFMIDHSVKEGSNQDMIASRRMQFVEIDPKGNANNAGWAPHLDLEPISEADAKLIQDVLQAPSEAAPRPALTRHFAWSFLLVFAMRRKA